MKPVTRTAKAEATDSVRTKEQQSLVARCRADSLKTADQLVLEQRDILCRVAVALGRNREDWDGDNLPGEVDVLRIRANTLADIVRGFAELVRHGEADADRDQLLASADRWARQ